MGTDKQAIREHLAQRLQGTYSDAELDAIAGALEDPAGPAGRRLTADELAQLRPGASDPTGTVIPSLGLDQHFLTRDIVHHVQHTPPADFFVDFKLSREDLENLAQLMSSEDPQDTLDRIFGEEP